ncbi:hypothetical protein AQUCO_02200149v1 [Aquilegia coerulea]|uniref:FBD domain-containing protein n=1 Tax=Aquilegia coerulea TaxID=218851 RepID=A0A2G5DDG3_AQUCA|nr:hypothetical protein AQUCO_02200149v1 [Aquilegia coerulea]
MLEKRKAEIESCQGSDLEFDLVRFLLGNADILEKMNTILSRENQTNATTSSSIKEKIEMFARVSPFAAISVSEINSGQWC